MFWRNESISVNQQTPNNLIPSIPLTEVYYFRELNCNNVELDWDYERVLQNLNTISVMIYQELTTDIRGVPN